MNNENNSLNKNAYYKKRIWSYISFGLFAISLIYLFIYPSYVFLILNICSLISCIISFVKKERYAFLYICFGLSLLMIIIYFGMYFMDNNSEKKMYEEEFYDTKQYIEQVSKNIIDIKFDENDKAILLDDDFKTEDHYIIVKSKLESLGNCDYYVIATKLNSTDITYNAELSCKSKYNFETSGFDSDYLNKKRNSDNGNIYSNYSFIGVKTYDESTNGIIYNNDNGADYYEIFYGLNVKSDGSICKDYLDGNCHNITDSKGNSIYVNYIFANDVRDNELEQTGIAYIIDRQGYLYETHFSLYDFSVGNVYSSSKVSKIGSQPNSDNQVFIFDDGTTLEFVSQNSLDLSELYKN